MGKQLTKEKKEFILKQIDEMVNFEFEIRKSIDNRSLAVIGVLSAVMTYILPKIGFSINENIECLSIILLIFKVLGFCLFGFGLIALIYVALPKKYKYFKISNIIDVSEERYKLNNLIQVVNENKSKSLKTFREVNEKKQKLFSIGTVIGIIGILLIVITDIINKI